MSEKQEEQKMPGTLAGWLAPKLDEFMQFCCKAEFSVHEAATWFLEREDLPEVWRAYGGEVQSRMLARDGSLSAMLRF